MQLGVAISHGSQLIKHGGDILRHADLIGSRHSALDC
jgi:hypothetical protein